jgi:ligand-binding sensor domain-containing protein
LSFSQLYGQSFEEKNFKLYTTKDGLTNNHITCVLQDNYGYVWIGTQTGLNRFDGSTFKKFFSDSSKKSLPWDYILKLKLLDAEQLAVSTQSGIHIINTRTLESHNLIIPPDSLKDEFIVNLIKDMTVDNKGNIFILTSTGFYQYDKNQKLVFRFDAVSREFVEKGAVYLAEIW